MARIHVALLRGINVGGRNRLPMAELRALFTEAGCTSVETYIQSGNVIFRAEEDVVARMGDEMPDRIADRFGFRVPVVLRTGEELRDARDRHPFVDVAADPKHLHIGFLAVAPTEEAIARLDPARSDVDGFKVDGREVFLHVPGGMARTKLTTDWFDRRLGTPMTARNWRTVNRLVEMAADQIDQSGQSRWPSA